MKPPPLKTYGHDISRSFLLLFIAVLVVYPFAFLLLVLLFENQSGHISDTLLVVGAVIWMTVFLGGMMLFVKTTTRRRKKWLDSVFCPLGLTGRNTMINWWEYHGSFAGREVLARFYKGPTLELIVSTALKTRFVISTPNELASALPERFQSSPLILRQASLSGNLANAIDPPWFLNLLDDGEVEGCLNRLLNAGQSWALIRQVILSPGELKLMLYRNKNLLQYDFTAEEVRGWLSDLTRFLDEAENGSSPLVNAELTSLEKSVRSGKAGRRAILIVLGFLLILSACFGMLLWLLVKYGG